MAYWEIDNVWAYLRGATDQEESELFSLLRVRPKNYYFDFRYRAGIWDGYTYFFDRTQKRILTGLLELVEQMGFVFERKYKVTPPLQIITKPSFTGVTPSEKQQQAIELINSGKNRGIFDLVTGAGKTLCIAAAAQMLNVKTLVIVPSIALCSQVASEITRLTGIKCSKVGSGCWDLSERVIVAIDDTVKRLPRWRQNLLAADIQLLQMDEVHNCTPKLYPFLQLCKSAYYRYGFSGTPFDMGKDRAVSLMGLFGPVLLKADAQDLVDSKRGVPSDFIFLDVDLPRSNQPDYLSIYEECVGNNNSFHRQVVELVKKHDAENLSILILVRRLSHGTVLKEMLRREGIACEYTHGRQDIGSRDAIKEKFKNEDLRVLIASDIYKEGVDLPCIDVLILASLGKSPKEWTQKVGRGLRSHPGKEKVLIYDFLPKGNKMLEQHAKQRLGYALKLKTAKVYKLLPVTGILEPVTSVNNLTINRW